MNAVRNLSVFIVLGLLAFVLLGWVSGLFYHAKIEIVEVEPFVAVYQDYVGEYSETAAIQDSLYDRLWEDGLENYTNFGIYFDDPQLTETHKMKSRVGRIIENNQLYRLNELGDSYNVFHFERQKCAVVEMPYRNFFSVYIGIYKAYPLLNEYAAAHGISGHSIVEIHDVPNKIIFILPLSLFKA